MQHYDINIPVGGAREINVQGDYVYYLSGSAGGLDDTITLRNISGSDVILLRPGQAFRLGNGDVQNRWLVGNFAGQGAIVGVLLMGAGEFSDNRTSGDVSVIDNSQGRVLLGQSFIACSFSVPALAANYSTSQIWNPPGSGKNLIVSKFIASSTTAGTLTGSFHALALANNNGLTRKKFSGGGSGVGNLRWGQAAVIPGDNGAIQAIQCAANLSVQVAFEDPLIIKQGYGLCISGAINQDVNVTYELLEQVP